MQDSSELQHEKQGDSSQSETMEQQKEMQNISNDMFNFNPCTQATKPCDRTTNTSGTISTQTGHQIMVKTHQADIPYKFPHYVHQIHSQYKLDPERLPSKSQEESRVGKFTSLTISGKTNCGNDTFQELKEMALHPCVQTPMPEYPRLFFKNIIVREYSSFRGNHWS